MTTTVSRRRQALLNTFDKHERMQVLLTCLGHSPALWEHDEDEDDQEDVEIKEQLVSEGLLETTSSTYVTTREGVEALTAYINEGNED